MVRGKGNLKKIQNPANRRVTFSKRKIGLLKKAKEISVLCEADVGLIIFSSTGKLFEFASRSMRKIMGKYEKYGVSLEFNKLSQECLGASLEFNKPSQECLEVLGLEVEDLGKRMIQLENMYKQMNGEDLDLLNFKSLKCIEKKMSLGARKIHSKKDKISREYLTSLKLKEKSLKLENAELDRKNGILNMMQIGRSHKACHPNIDMMEEANDELETDVATQEDLPHLVLV